MRFLPIALACSGCLAFSTTALAQDAAVTPATATTPAKDADEDEDDFGHFAQFGLRAGLVGGYRMVFRYEESPYCAEYDVAKSAKDQQKFCGHGAPLAIDSALSFALFDFLEPFLWGRFGLSEEEETGTNPLVIIGAGARFYATADSRFKVFIEPAVGFEFEGGNGEPLFDEFTYKKDMVFHVAAGPQLDINRHFGVYADAGLTVGIFRAIHSTLELQAGLQGRY